MKGKRKDFQWSEQDLKEAASIDLTKLTAQLNGPSTSSTTSETKKDGATESNKGKLAVSSGKGPIVLLVLSGSFNPVHEMHIQTMELARSELIKIGYQVPAGWIAPSSEQYVGGKLGAEA